MRSKKEYNAGRITIQQPHLFNKLESYQKFQKEKEEIQKKYPSKPWNVGPLYRGPDTTKNEPEEGWWEEWLQYKKEITDLLFQPQGNFQDFIWDITPERDELAVERFMRGRYKKEKQDE